MSKRSADGQAEGQAYAKTLGYAQKRDNTADDMGEFEDPWEDDLESDEEPLNEEAGGDEDGTRRCRYTFFEDRNILYRLGMDVDSVLPAIEESEERPPEPEPFIPGRHVLQRNEILEPDDSVYIMRHSMKVTWPCLSFDVLRDNLGDERQRYPATAYIVAGTQADRATNNELSVYKMSLLCRTQKDGGEHTRPLRI